MDISTKGTDARDHCEWTIDDAEKRVEARHNNIALMAAILLSGDGDFGRLTQREIEGAVITAEKIHAVIWDRNSSYQIESTVIEMAEEAHFAKE